MSGSGNIRGSARKDLAWKYSTQIDVPSSDGCKKAYKYLKCNFCSKEIKGGVKRVKEHLVCTHQNVIPCPKVPKEVKEEIKAYMNSYANARHVTQRNMSKMIDTGSYFGPSGGGIGSSSGTTPSSRSMRGPLDYFMVDKGDETGTQMTTTSVKEHQNRVCLEIGRFFFENGIPFNYTRSPSFISMLGEVGNFGRGLKPPSMHEMRTWILKEEVKTTQTLVDEIKKTWKKTGVSLMSDGWSDMRNRSLINFLVNNQYGTVFLKTFDASDCIKDAQKLFELLDGVIEEIGEDIVVQVITDNASAYKAAGNLLMEKRNSLYWTPYAAHCIDLMLEKIGEFTQHKTALSKAKRVANFIYKHQWVLRLVRRFAKNDLLRPAATRFATAFFILESILELKQPLQSMFVSSDWARCAWAKKDEGKVVKKIIMDEKSFWPVVVYSIKTTKPLVNVLRMVDGEHTPAMGFIYGAMDEAKELITKNFDGDLASYMEIWDVIDEKWDKQLHRDLHACAYYLNPLFRWSDNVSDHSEMKRGLYSCMNRLIKDPVKSKKVDDQLYDFTKKNGLFGLQQCLNSYMTRAPLDWWDQFGDDVPELKSFAMKVLGLTCSASTCERNWSTFNQVHTKQRNGLTTSRLNSLVFIMYNKKFKFKFLKKKSRKDEEDPLVVEDVAFDDEWIENPNDQEDESVENNDDGLTDDDDDGVESPREPVKRKRSNTQLKGKGKNVRGLVDEDEEDEREIDGDEHDHENDYNDDFFGI